MDDEEVRKFCRELLQTGMTPSKVKSQLTMEQFDPALIERIAEEYRTQWQAAQRGRRRLRQAAGLGLFLSCGGAFVYYVAFASERTMFFVWPLLAAAVLGLLWGFLPLNE